MKTLVLSGYTDNMEEVGRRCTATHATYALRHGFSHEVVRDYLPDTHPSHQKIRLIQERIPRYDVIVWLDADTAVTGPDKFIPDPSGSTVMDISIDWCAPWPDDLSTYYVSCGNFVFRRTPETDYFLAVWDRRSERFGALPHGCWEQDGLQSAMRADSRINRQVRRLPRATLNSVHRNCVNRNFPAGAPAPWNPETSFLLHLTNVDRIPLLNSLGL